MTEPFDYGTAPWSTGRAIRTAKISEVRAADLDRWGAYVMDLEEKLADIENDETPTRRLMRLRIREAKAIIESMMPYAKHMADVDWGAVNDWLVNFKKEQP